MDNFFSLKGKKIIVTGASSGIGREISIYLSKLGANLIITSRRLDVLEDTYSQLEGNGHILLNYDLEKVDSIEKWIKTNEDKFGKMDGLVHSAGIANTKPMNMTYPAYLEKVMKINFYSFVEIVRVLNSLELLQRHASIIAISSTASRAGNKGKVAYSASKSALVGAAKCMALELSKKKIRINLISPSFIRTKLFERYLENHRDSLDSRQILSRQYLGIGEANDVAKACAFLISKKSKFVTGSDFIIDGGYLS